MSFTIIKKGIPPEEQRWFGTCSKCTSEIECMRTDLTSYQAGDYKSGGPFSWESCPVCKNTMLFHPKPKLSLLQS
jgi:hypothetical protein